MGDGAVEDGGEQRCLGAEVLEDHRLVLLLVAGVAVHLGTSAQVGLGMVAVGLAAHLAAAAAGRRRPVRNGAR